MMQNTCKILLMFFFLPYLVSGQNNLDTLDNSNFYKTINGKVYFCDTLIRDADAKTFLFLEGQYSKDKNYVFFGAKRFWGADAKTFTVLQHGFSKDKNHVYFDFYRGRILKWADPKTFEILSFNVCKDNTHVFFRDDNTKMGYFTFKMQKKADAITFQKEDDYYYIDKNYIFDFEGNIIARRDTVDKNYLPYK